MQYPRRQIRHLSTLPLLAALMFLGVPQADAFECTRVSADSGPSLFWETRQVPVKLDQSVVDAMGSGIELEVEKALAEWGSVQCSDMALTFGGTFLGLRQEFNQDGQENENVLVYRELWPSAYPDDALAVTTTAFNTRSGEIWDADIEFNGEHFRYQILTQPCLGGAFDDRLTDFRNTLTHELGHVLGFSHPTVGEDIEEATMYADASRCETKKRTLESDDIQGLCTVYPVNQMTQQCFLEGGDNNNGGDNSSGCRAARLPGSWGKRVSGGRHYLLPGSAVEGDAARCGRSLGCGISCLFWIGQKPLPRSVPWSR